MKIEIGIEETTTEKPVKCRECGAIVTGLVFRVYFIVGEVTEIEYTNYYVCKECQWGNNKS